MNVPQLKVDDSSNQNNASTIVNVAPKSAILGSLHSDRPKVIRKIHLL
jgi:hypothetical protein